MLLNRVSSREKYSREFHFEIRPLTPVIFLTLRSVFLNRRSINQPVLTNLDPYNVIVLPQLNNR